MKPEPEIVTFEPWVVLGPGDHLPEAALSVLCAFVVQASSHCCEI